jgi:hypothetical protein
MTKESGLLLRFTCHAGQKTVTLKANKCEEPDMTASLHEAPGRRRSAH